MFNRTIRSLLPVEEVPVDGSYPEPFPLLKLQAPVLTGIALRLMLAVAESPLAGPMRTQLLRNNHIPQMLEEVFVPERPTFRPNTAGWAPEGDARLVQLHEQPAADRAAAASAALGATTASLAVAAAAAATTSSSGGGGGTRHYTASDFHAAYAAGTATPAQVAENIIAAVGASEAQSPPMRFLIAHDPELLRQRAAASTQRWREGRPLAPLDGVPFAVKDSCDALPYPTTYGTSFMSDWRTPVQSLAGVQALLDAGAMLIGKANLHEIGLGTTGLNITTGTPRNPHSIAHHTGGSSSGSAALVAAGVCPFAVGSDGGGSIRIPASLCGVVGLKPTEERIGTAVGTPPIDQTISVLGTLGATVQDCALMYALMANTGQCPGEVLPPVMLPAALSSGGGSDGDGEQPLAGKTAGICWKWFEDAEPAVLEACRAAVMLLQERGLAVVDVHLPELALLRAAHTCTIVSEMRNNMTAALQNGTSRRRMNTETRISLAMAGAFQAAHYVQSQKIRTRAEAHFRRAFARCNFLLAPTVPCTAPPIKPAALSCGETDLATTTSLMWYMQAANMLGLPAISVPVGAVPSTHAAAGKNSGSASTGGSDTGPMLLPVGLQLIAPCWHEASLLRAGAVLEAAVAAAGKALPLPPVWYDVLATPMLQKPRTSN